MTPNLSISKQRLILPIIVISQFCSSSIWFAGNSVIVNLIQNFNLAPNALGHLTAAVQFGFITGTLLFAIFSVADRFAPSKVFFSCAILGALFNLGMLFPQNSLLSFLVFRFLTGIFLAGIYPVGMKIAADYFEQGLGKSLGYMVGALVLGTAFPYLLKGFTGGIDWRMIAYFTSFIAVLGGWLLFTFVPNGPFRKTGQKINPKAWIEVFKKPEFKSAAFGYFGHMWELYAFWAFVPVVLGAYALTHPNNHWNIAGLSFVVIGIGSLGCVLGSYIAQIFGAKRVAFTALLLSCCCCLLSPLVFTSEAAYLWIGFLVFWGIVVTADSPLFSTLVAQNAAAENKGTALTIVTCIGFSITIISIQLLNLLVQFIAVKYIFMFLAIGPMLGLLALYRSNKIAVAKK